MYTDKNIIEYQKKWERFSTIRTRPHRNLVANQIEGYFFPVDKQPICMHPKVIELGEPAKEFILIQSLYKYSNDIAVTETELVNQAALKISSNRLPIYFDYHYRINALTVIVDEAYHAYVAMDCLKQIMDYTNVEPLKLPEEIELSKAIRKTKIQLPEIFHDCFDLIAVCIAENTLTKEIVTMKDNGEVNLYFQQIMKDHLADEGRHSGYFARVLEKLWGEIDAETKNHIGNILPYFISEYLGTDVIKAFDKRILTNLNFSNEEADQIINDTFDGFEIGQHHPMVKNITSFLARTGVLEHKLTKETLEHSEML